MPAFRDLRVARKFFYAFGMVCLLTAFLGTAALFGFLKVRSAAENMVNGRMPSMKALGDIRYSVSTIRRTDALLLLCDTPECTARLTPKRVKYVASYREAMQAYEPLVTYPGERELFEAIRANADAYVALSDQSRKLSDAGDAAAASKILLYGDAVKLYNATVDAVEADVTLNNRSGAAEGARTIGLVRLLLMTTCALMAITVLLCAIVGLTMTRLIVPPLRAATQALAQLAEKDLTAHVEALGQDEVGQLSKAINTSVGSMRDVLRTLTESGETLLEASGDLNRRAENSKRNAQTQSLQTSRIAAAAEQMTSTINEIGQNAEGAALSSRKSAEMATQGGVVMQSAASTMERIAAATESVSKKMDSLAHRSNEIGKVVGVIQEISEQTNLLALNAAIEAARAGEHGRGFAVVAGEVRRLAERTKSATEEIAGTIHSIQQETRETVQVMAHSHEAVESGLQDTANARNSLELIIASSHEVELQTQMIATASTEQAAASKEIAESASEISKLATENAEDAEYADQAGKKLSGLVGEMDQVIHQFRLDSEEQRGGNRTAAPAARPATRTPVRTPAGARARSSTC
jgi:methyl-accepting chemotaxis protein